MTGNILSELCPYCGQAITPQQLEEIRSRVRREEQQKLEIIQQQRDRQHAAALQQLQQQQAEERKRHQEQLVQQSTALRKDLNAKYAIELQAQGAAVQRAADAEVLKIREATVREREKLQEKVVDLERRLAQKPAHELGDGPERDLEQALREAFPEDRVRRVGRGENGADVIQEVIYRGEACGTIIFDSKNHKGWRNEFISKLKADMIRHGATYGVVTSSSFPAGESGLCIKDGIVIISPRNAVYLASILRATLTELHRQGLTRVERAQKMAAIYAYLGGGEFSARLKEAVDRIAALRDIDAKERSAHEANWKKREQGLTRMKAALDDIDSRVKLTMEGGCPGLEEQNGGEQQGVVAA
jgi:hypothetical protein